ncbi:MAG: AAA family ATPase [Bacteroidaceae bacterium]|nr:AAA family ATPase [Bacteroidaceae bacterium]
MTKNMFCAIRTQKSCEWLGYTDAPLCVYISIQPSRRPLSTYRVCVFNHDLYPLAEGYCISRDVASVRGKDEDGNPVFKLEFAPKGEFCWYPGEYVAVLYRGREPQSRCRFRLPDADDIEATAEMETYERGSDDYLAARDLYPSVFRFLPSDCSKSGFKQQLTAFYAREKSRKCLTEAGLGEEDPFTEFFQMLDCEIIGTPKSQHSRHIAVKVVAGNPLDAVSALVRALPVLDHPSSVGARREVWNIQKMLEEKRMALPQAAPDETLIIHNLTNLYEGGNAGTTLAEALTAALADQHFVRNRIVLCDRQEVIESLFAHRPELLAYFPTENHLTIDSAPSLLCFTRQLFDSLRRQHFEIDDATMRRISAMLYISWEGNERIETSAIDELVDEIMRRHSQRLLEQMSGSALSDGESRQLHYSDVESTFEEYRKQRIEAERKAYISDVESLVSIDDCPAMQALNALTGLERVKSEVSQALIMARFSALRQSYRLEEPSAGRHHMLFVGNPGTGKTTVAKLIGEIYHRLGVLSKGHTVVCDRASLVGRYIGESEEKVSTKLEEARGGVLFIDEAYSLYADSTDRDFGRHVIECLLTALSEPEPDMIIIFAGYEDRLSSLFDVNPGLRDRFPITLHFDNFSADELYAIIRSLAERRHFAFTASAEEAVRRLIARRLAVRDAQFGNARWATNIFELGILRAMAERTMKSLSAASDERMRLALLDNPETLTHITEDDIHLAETQYIEAVAPRKSSTHRIGFLAQSA